MRIKEKIILIEPDYKSKYPPLGLMKISTYHKIVGDNVFFVKGCDPQAKNNYWDRIYITTLFTFHWDKIINTIKYYTQNTPFTPRKIFIGGIAASLLKDRLYEETGIKPIVGPLNGKPVLDSNRTEIIDNLIPDYEILNQINYKYPTSDAYFAYTTRGCIRRCSFCAVPTLEPDFIDYIDIKPIINKTARRYEEKKDLILLDNNVLASKKFNKIIDDIVEVGFYSGSMYKNRVRRVDFNQGIDPRLLKKHHMKDIIKIALRPMRLAFDRLLDKKHYENAIRLAADFGQKHFSNYILYNYRDKPKDLWERLHITVELNEELRLRIFSFPMKYLPVYQTDRSFVGSFWNRRYLRGIQCITLVTYGCVAAGHEFFHEAFGSDPDEFLEILSMPDRYIIDRNLYKNNDAYDWKKLYKSLTVNEKNVFLQIVSYRNKKIIREEIERARSLKLRKILSHYL